MGLRNIARVLAPGLGGHFFTDAPATHCELISQFVWVCQTLQLSLFDSYASFANTSTIVCLSSKDKMQHTR